MSFCSYYYSYTHKKIKKKELDASLDGDKPRFLTPLVATAQTVVVENKDIKKDADYSFDSRLKIDVEVDLVEPSSIEPTSILSDLRTDSSLGISIPDTTESSVASRMSVRKKIFNTLAADKSSSSYEPQFSMHKVYTFEFFQVRFTGDNVGYITSLTSLILIFRLFSLLL